MKVRELYPDVITEDLCYEYKAKFLIILLNGQKLLLDMQMVKEVLYL